MSFDRFVCWQPEEASQVLDPEAESIDDPVFLAVHSDRPLSLVTGGYSTGSGPPIAAQWSAREFVDAFLDSNRHHVKAVVLGGTGTGKSHFIRWLQLNLPPSKRRKVLLVPKGGTSLRAILQRIIAELPADAREAYTQRLSESAFDSEPEHVRRQRLASNIGLAIMADQPARESEEEEWLIRPEGLPLIFFHPVLTAILTRPDGIIADLVEHVSGGHRYQRRETARSFQAEDLPLTGFDLKEGLDPKTRDVVAMLLGDGKVREAAVAVINRNLRPAIQRVLNFSGEQLGELMAEVRRHLAACDQELVLLIEDFTRLQGLDQALLDALLVGSERDGPGDLSVLRWAMAVTKGYYLERVDKTVQSRLDFVVDMDLMASSTTADPTDNLSHFAAKYVNAVRVPSEILREWGSQIQAGSTSPAPNPCEECTYREECHDAFGEIDGVGLYPFSKTALPRMLGRIDPAFPETFNPRNLVGITLREVLVNRRREFETKSFPSKAFHGAFGGSRLAPRDRERLLVADPADGTRREIIIDLWAPAGDLNGPAGVLRGFGLGPIQISDAAPAAPTTEPEPEKGPARTQHEVRVAAVRAWGNGAKMPEVIARDLRSLIYDSVTSYVDWDAEGMERGFFTRRSGGSFFQARHIAFANQETATSPGPVALAIPLEADDSGLRRAAIAIEGLLNWQQKTDLEAEGGFDTLIDVAGHVSQWADNLLAQLRPLGAGSGPDSALRAAGLLVLGGLLGGVITAGSDADVVVEQALGEWPEDVVWAAPGWRDLYRRIQRVRQSLRDVALSRLAMTKGGSTAAGLIDASELLAAARSLRESDWEPPQIDGRETARIAPLDDVADAAAFVGSRGGGALEAEWARQRDWLAAIDQDGLPHPAGRAIRDALVQLRAAADRAGLRYSLARGLEFAERLQSFDPGQFDEAREQLESVSHLDSTPSPAFLAARARMGAIEQWKALARTFEAFAKEVESGIELTASAEGLLGSIDHDREDIATGLSRTVTALMVLEQTS